MPARCWQPLVVRTAAGQGLGRWADPAGRAAAITLPCTGITPLGGVTPALSPHIHQINMKQLSKMVTSWEFVFDYMYWLISF